MKKENITSVFSYRVEMLVHVVADDEATAKSQLDEKGGIVTKRDVELLNTVVLYGEEKDE